MRCLHPPPVAGQGFTLVELLVALTLMALVSVILFGGLRFGVRAWETGGARMEQAHRIEAVQNLLRRQISQARFLPHASDTDATISFAGDGNSLTFIAPLPAHRGIAGPYLFNLRTGGRAGQSDLTLTWSLYWPELLTTGASGFEDGTTLLEDVAEIELSYFGAPFPDQPAQWWNAWDLNDGQPQLVRMRVEFPPGDRRRWPDLIVRVHGTAD
jgi:general secretion pathway protein J